MNQETRWNSHQAANVAIFPLYSSIGGWSSSMCDILDKKGGQCTIAHILMLGDMCKQVKFGSHSMPRQRKLIRQKETGTLSSSCLPPGAKLISFRVMTSLISFSKSLIGLPIDRRPKCWSVPGSEHRWPQKILPSPPTSWLPPTPGYHLSPSSASN